MSDFADMHFCPKCHRNTTHWFHDAAREGYFIRCDTCKFQRKEGGILE
jgi:hypothetical protein